MTVYLFILSDLPLPSTQLLQWFLPNISERDLHLQTVKNAVSIRRHELGLRSGKQHCENWAEILRQENIKALHTQVPLHNMYRIM